MVIDISDSDDDDFNNLVYSNNNKFNNIKSKEGRRAATRLNYADEDEKVSTQAETSDEEADQQSEDMEISDDESFIDDGEDIKIEELRKEQI